MQKEVAFHSVFDSQATFRALLSAMSRPGTVTEICRPEFESVPDGLSPHVLTIALTLCDNQVSIAFLSNDENLRTRVENYLMLNLGSDLAPVSQADYVLCDGAQYADEFRSIPAGDPEFPEHGATAVIQVGALWDHQEGAGSRVDASPTESRHQLVLSGPGIADTYQLDVDGLDQRYLADRAYLCREYPTGIDLLLVDETGFVSAIPRSTSIQDSSVDHSSLRESPSHQSQEV